MLRKIIIHILRINLSVKLAFSFFAIFLFTSACTNYNHSSSSLNTTDPPEFEFIGWDPNYVDGSYPSVSLPQINANQENTCLKKNCSPIYAVFRVTNPKPFSPDMIERIIIHATVVSRVGIPTTEKYLVLDTEGTSSSAVRFIPPDMFAVDVTYSDNNPLSTSIPGGYINGERVFYNMELRWRLDAGGWNISFTRGAGTALYSLRTGIDYDRRGHRDLGGDDWGAHETFLWLRENHHWLPEIDDISGEHGRNIGHVSHQHGRDIDMAYMGPPWNTDTSGRTSYKVLYDLAFRALTDPNPLPARQRLKSFATTNVEFINRLLADDAITLVMIGQGRVPFARRDDAIRLKNGWMKSLFCAGSVTDIRGNVLDLMTPTLNCPQRSLVFDRIHESHIHVRIDPDKVPQP